MILLFNWVSCKYHYFVSGHEPHSKESNPWPKSMCGLTHDNSNLSYPDDITEKHRSKSSTCQRCINAKSKHDSR